MSNQGGLFLLKCNYDVDQINISSTFYYELLLWWSNLRETVEPESEHKYIIWNNREILIEGNSVFYRHYFENGIKHTKDLLFDKTNIESFNAAKGKRSIRSNFLVWTGLRQSVPLNLRVNMPNFKVVLDLENYKCHDYYCHLIKHTYERPRKWAKLGQEFDLEDDQLSEAYLLPLKVASEPYVRSFQYKVLNSILYTNDLLYKIGYVSNPNCSFCRETRETLNHFLFECSFSNSFWNKVISNILNKLSCCRCLSLCDVIIGILKEEMDLVNYVIILGKNYLWTCRHKEIKPSFCHFKRILKNKYDTEKHIAFNSNKINLFNKKWEVFEVSILHN